VGRTHTVKQGEYLSRIAHENGFANWRTIYDHPQNAGLRDKRPNPNVLLPGDLIYIPDKIEKKETCGTGQTHRFQLDGAKNRLRIVLKDDAGRAMSGEQYTLKVSGKEYKSATKSDGLINHPIPNDATSGTLKLDKKGITLALGIGHLDPIHDQQRTVVSGAQARLNNLGFHCGKVDGILGPKTETAIMRFQKVVLKREEPDGKIDSETRDRLLGGHGS
jgi:N-acetylmuramoyl-L-alanine amidase